jgi:hypothetical protein
MNSNIEKKILPEIKTVDGTTFDLSEFDKCYIRCNSDFNNKTKGFSLCKKIIVCLVIFTFMYFMIYWFRCK